MIKKIFTMNNSLEDSNGYEDPDAFKIEEVPKTMNFHPTVEYIGQVITPDRILGLQSDLEESKIIEEQNSTFQTEKSSKGTKYKYAFGSRVKEDQDFDKGLGVIGVGRTGSAKKRNTDYSQKRAKPKMRKKKNNVASRIDNKPPKRPAKKPAPEPEEVYEKQKQESSVKKDRTPLEIELANQKLKLEKQFNVVTKEEEKLEAIKKRRKDLFSNPFKNIKPEEKFKKGNQKFEGIG